MDSASVPLDVSERPVVARITPLQQRLLNVLAALVSLVWLAALRFTLTPKSDDFKQYWQAVMNFRHTGNPYVDVPGSTAPLKGFFYPPLFTYLVQPIGLVDQLLGQVLWYVFNCLAVLGLVALCMYLSRSHSAHRYWGVVLLGVCIAPPTRITLQLGQISILIALAVIGGFALTRRHAWLSGLLLAIASLIRIYPAMLGFYYLLNRSDRRVVWYSIGSGVLLLIGSALIYGVEPYMSFIQFALGSNGYPYTAEHNISFAGFFWRLLEESRFAIPVMQAPQLARILVGISSLLVVGMCLWCSRATASDQQRQLQFGIWLCGMMLISTSNGYYTLVLLLLPLLSVVRYLETTNDRVVRNTTILATLLVCVPPGWSANLPEVSLFVHVGLGQLLLTPSLHGLCLYFWLLTHVLHQVRYKAPGEEIASSLTRHPPAFTHRPH